MAMKDPIEGKPALAALAVISWFCVLLQFWLSIRLAWANGKTIGEGVGIVLGYFTVLTNIFVALTATLPLIAGFSRPGRWFAKPIVLGCATTSILIVGITYHLLLRNVWRPEGPQLLADIMLHYVVPILALAYWLAFPPRVNPGVLAPLVWCLYPIGYFAYVFVRGVLMGSYPYYFIDVTRLGYGRALINSSGLLVSFVVMGAAVLTCATVRNHFRPPPIPVGD